MGNAAKGEVSFDAAGKTWTLRFGTNAICALETALGMGFAAALALLSDGTKVRVATIRSLVWAGLSGAHDDLTEEQAGELIDAIGIAKAGTLISEAVTLAFPAEGKAAAARPTNRQAARSKPG